MPSDKEVRYYSIRNWAQKFENNRTRELKFLDWVPVSNRMDSDGYIELVDHPEGAAHFGIWIGCVMIASRCENPALRGVLLREDGSPHTTDSIARHCRIPAPLCGIAISRLTSLGWLQELTRSQFNELPKPHDTAGISHNGAMKPQHGAGLPHPRARVVNGTEQNRTTNTPQPPSTEGGKPSSRLTRQERKRAESIAEIERHAKGVHR